MELRPVEQIIREALMAELAMLLANCTAAQVARFGQIYPKGIVAMTESQLKNAIGLAQRTIRKRETGNIHGSMTAPAQPSPATGA